MERSPAVTEVYDLKTSLKQDTIYCQKGARSHL